MNAFRTLIQQLARWPSVQRRQLGTRPTEAAFYDKHDASAKRSRAQRFSIPDPVMFALVVLSLTGVIGYRFYNQPSLSEEMPAPETVRAPRAASVEDEEQTKAKREAAKTGSVQFLKIDEASTQTIQETLDERLGAIEQMRQAAGEFPFVEPSALSLPSQRYLRSTGDAEWSQIVSAAEEPGDLNDDEPLAPLPTPSTSAPDALAATPSALSRRQAIGELRNYRQENGESALQALLTDILFARRGYQTALAEVELDTENPISPAARQLFLNLPDDTWQATRRGLVQAAEQILTQGIPRGLPDSLLQRAVRVQLRPLVPQQSVLPTATEVLTSLLEPNLVEDQEETRRQAAEAAQQVESIIHTVEYGEVIVEAGQPIDRRAFVLLDEFNKTGRGINWHGLALTAMTVSGAVGVFELVRHRTNVRLRCRDRLLLCLLSLSAPVLPIVGVEQLNLAAIGLLVSSFYNPLVAVAHVSLLTGLTAFSSIGPASPGLGLAPLLAGGTGGLLAAAIAGRLRSREELAFLGGAVGLSQGTVHLVVTLIPGAAATTVWSISLLPGAAIFGLSGLAWCIVALGISPYLERLFDLVTPIRLAELANPNRPLLKRLATQAPGTFQHTLFVSSLAEAAARELHGNVELVRTGTLYHDIGKMHDPLGFIENQMGGPNKHDTIADPQRSAQIIKKHVSEGLVMARKHGLPQAVRDFIPEHQGTILISYFYFQAKQQAQASGYSVDEADFRYDGPIPQSRETGIVMLADACEAALRSLKEATPDTALSMVNKIFKARWQDGQLAESGLRREELPIIAEVFVRVWQQYNHQRIAYPKAALDHQASRSPA